MSLKKRASLLSLALSLVLIGASVMTVQAAGVITRDVIEKEVLTEVDFIKTADNFVILFDSSSSTNSMLKGTNMTRIQAARKLLIERNQLLPDLGFNAGLYTYTPWKAYYGMQRYDRDQMDRALNALPERGSGPGRLQAAMSNLRSVLAGLSGRTAVFLFTDGRSQRVLGPKSAKQIAQSIASDHNVCFYVISSAVERTERRIVQAVSEINACSRVVPMQAFFTRPEFTTGALFTVQVTSYVKLTPVSEVVGFQVPDIFFDFNKVNVKSVFKDDLGKLAMFLQENPNAYAVVSGFTDNIGSEEVNLMVSKGRALTVANYLTQMHNIDPLRVVPLWFGKSNPTAPNTTENGRRLNRRVEIAVGGME